MNSSTAIQHFRRAIDQYGGRPGDDGPEFDLPLNVENVEKLKKLHSEKLFDGMLNIDGAFYEINEINKSFSDKTATVILDISYLKNNEISVFKNFDDFIADRRNQQNIPSCYYLLQEDYFSLDDTITHQQVHYTDFVLFLKLLISLADYQEKLNDSIIDKIIFLHKSKIEIPLLYDKTFLEAELDGLSIITSIFAELEHQEQKYSIFKEVLFGLLVKVKPEERLKYLTKHFGDFSRALNENYQLFVSEFSFEKVRSELEEKKRDYLIKINSIFTDISIKLLSVPIAFSIASSKMIPLKGAKVNYIEVIIQNSAVLLAVILASIYIIMLINSQKDSLGSISSEYKGLLVRFKHRYPNHQNKVKDMAGALKRRGLKVRKNLMIAEISTYGVIFGSVLLYLSHFQKCQILVKNFLIAIETYFNSLPPLF